MPPGETTTEPDTTTALQAEVARLAKLTTSRARLQRVIELLGEGAP